MPKLDGLSVMTRQCGRKGLGSIARSLGREICERIKIYAHSICDALTGREGASRNDENNDEREDPEQKEGEPSSTDVICSKGAALR